MTAIEVTPLDSLELPDPRWLVDDLLVEGEVNELFGPSDHGKSQVALDVAYSVASGFPSWHGKAISGSGNVVYITPEGLRSLKARGRAWREHHDPGAPVGVVHVVRDLGGPLHVEGWVERLAAAVKELRPVLIVLDNLSALAPSLNENDSDGMSAVAAMLRKLQRETGATIWLLHHPAKRGDPRLERGHYALRAAMEYVVRVERLGRFTTLYSERSRSFGVDTKGEEVFRFSVEEVAGWPVVVPAPLLGGASASPRVDLRSTIASKVMEVVRRLGEGGKLVQRGTIASEVGRASADSTFGRALTQLVREGDLASPAQGLYGLPQYFPTAPEELVSPDSLQTSV